MADKIIGGAASEPLLPQSDGGAPAMADKIISDGFGDDVEAGGRGITSRLSEKWKTMSILFAVPSAAMMLTLEIFGVVSSRVVKAAEGPGLFLAAHSESSINSCFDDISAEQPFWLVLVGGWTQTAANLVVFGFDLEKPPSLFSYGFAFAMIALKLKMLHNDVASFESHPWYCAQILATGSMQLPTTWASLARCLIILASDKRIAPGHLWICGAFVMVTVVPYLPAMVVAFFVDGIPSVFIFCPVVALVSVIVFSTYFLLVGVAGEVWTDKDIGNAAVAYGAAAPLTVMIKFFGEAVARFYAGEGWWMSMYSTWAERTLVLYSHRVEHSVNSALNAVAFFL